MMSCDSRSSFGLRRSCCSRLLIAVSTGSRAVADVKKEETIESLANKTYQVRPGKLIVNSTDKARDSYKAFLDLVSDDPELRAEAMRRARRSRVGRNRIATACR